MKKFICITLVLLMVCGIFCGCQAKDQAEEAKKEPVPHMQYDYNLHFFYGYSHRNLITPTPQAFDGGAMSFALVKSAEEFSELVSLEGTIGEFAEKNGLTEEDSYILEDDLDWVILTQTSGFGLFVPDEAFFAEHNLLVVDICGGDGALRLRANPVNLVLNDGYATVDVCWSGDFSSTADKAGRLCLISLPKDCEMAEVNFIYDSENSNYYNPFE